MSDPLQERVGAVVRAGNCSGCGGCSLLDGRVRLQLVGDGFVRPVFSEMPPPEGAEGSAERDFARCCPGVDASPSPAAASLDENYDSVLGRYESVWLGYANDEGLRFAGSSGGVLSALSIWLLASGRSTAVVSARPDSASPTLTMSSAARSRSDVELSAGSRYAPVANLANPDLLDDGVALVAKPCEAQFFRRLRGENSSVPILTFFCAGTPAQRATSALLRSMRVDAAKVRSLRYRGNGWPGAFTVVDNDGSERRIDYEQSWGEVLGRDVQWRCKVCADGTGESGDISVGDLWLAQESGYPSFGDAPGQSAVVVRTPLGREILDAAVGAGVITVRRISIEQVRRSQPLHVTRRLTVRARLLGRRLVGHQTPHLSRKSGVPSAWRHPALSLRALLGTVLRSLGSAPE